MATPPPSSPTEESILSSSQAGKTSPPASGSVGHGSITITDYLRISVAASALCWVVFLSCHHAVSPLPRHPHVSMKPQSQQVGVSQNMTVNDRSRRRLYADIQLERTTYKLPFAVERNFIDWDGSPTQKIRELPLFWDVAMSGSTHVIKVIYAQCYHLVEACEIGKNLEWKNMVDASENQDVLRVVTSMDGRKYVNVDTSNPEGIKEASQLGFAKYTSTDLIITPFLLVSAESLFDANSRGRMFSVFRHPVDRAVRLFYTTKDYSIYSQWTIDEYARSSYSESNGMVRTLTGKMVGAISSEDTAKAKELLLRKCLVGLADDPEESFARFHQFFGFGNPAQLQCVIDGFANATSHSREHPVLAKTSETWTLLANKNWADIRLYEYVQHLFVEQGKWLKQNKGTLNRGLFANFIDVA